MGLTFTLRLKRVCFWLNDTRKSKLCLKRVFFFASSLTVLSFLFFTRGERYCFTSVHFLWKTDMLFNQPQQFILLILIIAEVIKYITKLPPMCTNLLLLHTSMKFSRIKKSTSSKLHFRGITNILYEKYPLLQCRKLMSGTPLCFFCLVAYLKAWHRNLNIKIRSYCENVDSRIRLWCGRIICILSIMYFNKMLIGQAGGIGGSARQEVEVVRTGVFWETGSSLCHSCPDSEEATCDLPWLWKVLSHMANTDQNNGLI